MQFNSTIKGLLTGGLMVILGIFLFWKNADNASPLQYLGFLIYGVGIVWSVYPAAQNGVSKFGSLFYQGFRCFVVVTLVMAVFTFVFFQMNSGIIDKNIAAAKQERLKTAKDRTPEEIEEEANTTRKYYIPILVSQTIFQYLLIGVIVTVTTAGALSLSKKQ